MSIEQLEALRGDVKKCVRCSLCKLVPMPTIRQTRFTSACPPVDTYHFHAYSGGGMQVMALALLDGRISADDDLAQVVSACTLCGACDVSCKFIMAAERYEVILALKQHLAELGLGARPARSDTASPGHWADGMGLKTLPGATADVLLLAGSGAARNASHAATARKLAELLQLANVDFGILEGHEPDTGIEVYWTGHKQVFLEQARATRDRLDAAGAKRIVALCGEDLGMLRAKYPRHGLGPQAAIMHASELLLHLMRKGKLRLRRSLQRRVTYHDPCYLGRQSEPPQFWHGEERLTHGVMRYFVPPKPINYGTNGVYEAPRQILQAVPGLRFVEMHRVREYAYCCGGGGGVPDAHPDVARDAAMHRLDEAEAAGADLVATACQHCRHNLTRWGANPTLQVTDIVDLVHQAAGLSHTS